MTQKRILLALLILILLSVLGYNYIYQDHREISSEQPEFTLTANKVSVLFKENSIKAEEKYLNKTIEIEGKVTEITTNSLTLNDIVFCQFSDALQKSIQNNTILKIKGRLIGYDDLLEQVKLDQCIIN